MGWGSGTANFPYLVDPLSAIANWVHGIDPTVVVDYLLDDFNLVQASKLAAKSDLCMVFANSDSGEGYITVDNTAGDRSNITLWHGGDALINATVTQCKNTIVVLHTVGPVIMEPWINHPNITDVLYAGLPGQESGNALLDVLTGAVNPSGRLPYTIAKDPNDYPAQVVYTNPNNDTIIHIPYDEELEIDYRHFDSKGIQPRFEFGFGLSYT
jgi:beta-glucosidase